MEGYSPGQPQSIRLSPFDEEFRTHCTEVLLNPQIASQPLRSGLLVG
jgi:hypothetical protein